MAQDAENLVVASGGSVWVADVGTTAPVTPTGTPAAPWVELGLISDEGASFQYGKTVEEFKSWQRRNAVKRTVTEEEITASFTLQEWKKTNFTFAFGGGSITNVSAGIYRYNFPTGNDELAEKSLLLRWDDDGKSYQIHFERGSVTDPVETSLSRTALAQLPISFKALSAVESDSIGVSFLTDDPMFGLGS
jgi:hypothetical protein